MPTPTPPAPCSIPPGAFPARSAQCDAMMPSCATPPCTATRGQLLGARRGLITSMPATGNGSRRPLRRCGGDSSRLAAWAALARAIFGYSVYLARRPAPACRRRRALAASALLARRGARGRLDGACAGRLRRRVVEVIRDEIGDQPQAADALLLPAEARLQRLALALSDDPADTRIAQWADWIGMAPRTLRGISWRRPA